MQVVAVYKDDGERGHHMQDYIPKEELAKFMSQAGDDKLQRQVSSSLLGRTASWGLGFDVFSSSAAAASAVPLVWRTASHDSLCSTNSLDPSRCYCPPPSTPSTTGHWPKAA